MKPKIPFFIAFLLALAYTQPTFLNGNFEINTHPAGACNWSYLNMSNAMWNSTVSFSNAYGASQSLDLMHTSCTWGPAQNGNFFAGVDYSNGNAFTLTISAPVTAGTTYTISFWDKGDPCCPPAGPMQIGLSTVNNATGTVIYTGVPSTAGVWNNRVFSFVAPFAAQYISVQGTGGAFWSNVDNFTFQTPLPASISDFQAYRITGNTSRITWQVDHPEQYQTWFLDRSSDGIHFSEVRELSSQVEINHYQTDDSVPPMLPSVYYRVRGRDLNGNILVSSTIELPLHSYGSQPMISVYPNPVQASAGFRISWMSLQDDHLPVSLVDVTGRQVWSMDMAVKAGYNELEVPGLPLASGCYVLRIGSLSRNIVIE